MFENAGRLTAKEYQRSILYSTLSPCDMCSDTALLYKIPKIVIGENKTFQLDRRNMLVRGRIRNLNDAECIKLMEDFITNKSALWNEDWGVKTDFSI